MTLGDLIRKAREVGGAFNTYEIPLMKDGLHVKFDLEAEGSNEEGWHINVIGKQAFLDTDKNPQVLPGFENEPVRIPGKDFVPVDWVETLENYGIWEIVRVMPTCAELNNAAEEYARNIPQDSSKHLFCITDFKAGANWNRKKSGWISVKDRLPDTTEYVFTCVKMNGIPQCVGFHYYKDGKWWEGYEEDSVGAVEYWMQIPKFKEAKK